MIIVAISLKLIRIAEIRSLLLLWDSFYTRARWHLHLIKKLEKIELSLYIYFKEDRKYISMLGSILKIQIILNCESFTLIRLGNSTSGTRVKFLIFPIIFKRYQGRLTIKWSIINYLTFYRREGPLIDNYVTAKRGAVSRTYIYSMVFRGKI